MQLGTSLVTLNKSLLEKDWRVLFFFVAVNLFRAFWFILWWLCIFFLSNLELRWVKLHICFAARQRIVALSNIKEFIFQIETCSLIDCTRAILYRYTFIIQILFWYWDWIVLIFAQNCFMKRVLRLLICLIWRFRFIIVLLLQLHLFCSKLWLRLQLSSLLD